MGSDAFLGGEGGHDLSGLATHLADAGGIFKLAGGLLEPEVERLMFQVAKAAGEFISREFVNVFGFRFGHGSDGVRDGDQACGLRVMRRVRMPSL